MACLKSGKVPRRLRCVIPGDLFAKTEGGIQKLGEGDSHAAVQGQ